MPSTLPTLASAWRRITPAGLAVVPVLTGCLLVAAGAGAAGGVYYTKRGVESLIDAPLDGVVAATERAMRERDIRIRRTERSHDTEEGRREAQIEGTTTVAGPGGRTTIDVEVSLQQQDRRSVRVHVVAKRSEIEWDKEFARGLLDRIVSLSR